VGVWGVRGRRRLSRVQWDGEIVERMQRGMDVLP
jgi:hypothetical protein